MRKALIIDLANILHALLFPDLLKEYLINI